MNGFEWWIAAAAEAVECFGEDELELYAAEDAREWTAQHDRADRQRELIALDFNAGEEH